ncbi:chemotaxis protein CheW [Shumkonia mesophila]|uniref:chemotaxis protein CheW n=1 Tax=Shumkonia mesophila TaxID=2838854 RepID=UPI00293420BC|nr:chemotaxis protein CheW [Shumkonia mesophila]
MNARTAVKAETSAATAIERETREYVTLTIAGQWFGIPVLTVQDVLGPRDVARIPLADPVIAGSINLRGRIVTVIDMRKRLALPPRPDDKPGMNVVVEHGGNLYSLLIDAVGEVMEVPGDKYEKNPATIDPLWRDFSEGIYRLKNQLLIVLNVEKLFEVGETRSN